MIEDILKKLQSNINELSYEISLKKNTIDRSSVMIKTMVEIIYPDYDGTFQKLFESMNNNNMPLVTYKDNDVMVVSNHGKPITIIEWLST